MEKRIHSSNPHCRWIRITSEMIERFYSSIRSEKIVHLQIHNVSQSRIQVRWLL